jgi:hypothetical protein
MDAGTAAVVDALGADGKRISHWILPEVPEADRDKMRPDRLRIPALNAGDGADAAQRLLASGAERVVQVIEVGYGSDTR